VEDGEHATYFYANLRGGLREHGVKIQSNTTDEGLLIRFVPRPASFDEIESYLRQTGPIALG